MGTFVDVAHLTRGFPSLLIQNSRWFRLPLADGEREAPTGGVEGREAP
jgi:hypothetical protein